MQRNIKILSTMCIVSLLLNLVFAMNFNNVYAENSTIKDEKLSDREFFSKDLSNYNIENIEEQIENTSNPKTGDNIMPYFIIFIVAIIGMVIIAVIIIVKGKKKESKH